jgi:hypothetical protein
VAPYSPCCIVSSNRKFSFDVALFHPIVMFLTAKKNDLQLNLIFGQKLIFLSPKLAGISRKFPESFSHQVDVMVAFLLHPLVTGPGKARAEGAQQMGGTGLAGSSRKYSPHCRLHVAHRREVQYVIRR